MEEEQHKSLPDQKDDRLLDPTNENQTTRRTNSSATKNDHDGPPPESSRKPVFTPGTYVVQVPKDQIYRVPPPENASMLEQRINGGHNKRGQCCFSRCCNSCIFMLFGGR
ncbi:hypothetical protein OROMI_010648 [Orobanche minor]